MQYYLAFQIGAISDVATAPFKAHTVARLVPQRVCRAVNYSAKRGATFIHLLVFFSTAEETNTIHDSSQLFAFGACFLDTIPSSPAFGLHSITSLRNAGFNNNNS